MQDTAPTTDSPEDSFSYPHSENYKDGPYKLKRNQYGLLQNVDYKFDENGWVMWKDMINPKFLYPNKGWFERAGKPIPDSIEGLEDHQLLCKLGGYKELARLRGFRDVSYELIQLENGVSAICTINWIANFEARESTFSSIANSTSENCGDFFAPFKETQAENRSFVRCVRNFLNVNVAGDDELPKGKVEEAKQENSPDALNPQKNLEKLAAKKGFKSYASFKEEFLIPKKFSPKEKPKTSWSDYADIPANECWRITNLLNE